MTAGIRSVGTHAAADGMCTLRHSIPSCERSRSNTSTRAIPAAYDWQSLRDERVDSECDLCASAALSSLTADSFNPQP